MRRFRPALLRSAGLLTTVACLLVLAACEDPSGVGLTVLDPEENDPRATVLQADGVAIGPLPDETGAFVTSADFPRFAALAGAAADPLLGALSAEAYLDVLPPQSLPEGFRDRPIEQARLRLVRSYVYGDTLRPTTLEVQQIAEEWAAVGATSDTSFAVLDGVITQFEVTAADSLVEIPLPADWLAANDTTLRSANGSNLFHGFRLSASGDAAAVYGFNGRSSLELISEGDTVRFGASELFSHVEAEPAALPDGLAAVRDGSGTGLRFAFDLDTLGAPVLSTAAIRVTADTAAAKAALPAGFVRPLARELALFGIIDDERPLLLGRAELDEPTQTYSFRSATITAILQDLVLGEEPLTGFAIGVAPGRSGLGVMPLVTPPSDDAPRAVVVAIPTQG